MRTFTHAGTEIGYIDQGKGPVTLLFLHGLFADQSYWDEQVRFFSPNYRVIAIDLPGHGVSGRERQHWSIRTFGEDLAAFLHDLELTNVVLIAHGLAADVALAAIVARPGAMLGFIAIDFYKNAGLPQTAGDHQPSTSMLDEYAQDPAATSEAYARQALLTGRTPDAVADRIVRDFRQAHTPMSAQLLPDALAAYEIEARLLPKLDKKLYLINIDYTPTDERALGPLLNAGYELLHMAGTSHYPMLENPAELNRLLDIAIEHIGEPEASPGPV